MLHFVQLALKNSNWPEDVSPFPKFQLQQDLAILSSIVCQGRTRLEQRRHGKQHIDQAPPPQPPPQPSSSRRRLPNLPNHAENDGGGANKEGEYNGGVAAGGVAARLGSRRVVRKEMDAKL